MSEQPQTDRPSIEAPTNASPVAGAPRSGLPTSTVVVGSILIAVVGFGLGFAIGHRTGRPAFPFARYAHMGAMPWMGSGGMPGTGMPGFGMPGSGGYGGISGTMPGLPSGDGVVAGTVTDVRGDSFTIRTFRGDTVTVVTSGSTVVRGVSGAVLGAVQPGERVLVAGVPQADGSIAATQVLEGLFGSAASPVPGSSSVNG
jgi:uncharacterized protein DUF5666